MNLDILPNDDQETKDVQLVKEQILELNDKFDYLLYLMIKAQKINYKNQEKQYEISDSKVNYPL